MIGRRLIGAIPVLLGISFLVFLLMHLAPGDPVVLLLGDDATPADVARVRHEWGLDQSLPVQYWQFVSRAMVGDFGQSLKFGEPVLKLVFERLPATIELAVVSLLVAILISIPIGVYSAIKRDTLIDHAGTGMALIGVSLPNFWLGIMLIYFLGGQWNLLPVAGRIEYGIEVVMRQEYVMTARAKGLSERVVVWRHILRNALITVITILGLQLGALLNGSVITETVFSYPGIGDLLIQSISVRDYRLTQVLILFFGVIYFVVNMLVDVLYTLVDPRIKL